MQKFTEEILVESVGDKWVLKRAFKFYYADKEGVPVKEVVIAEGFVTDFASTPKFLYPWFPPIGIYNKAAMVHDFLYSSPESFTQITRAEADKFFLQAMKVLDVPAWKRRLMYFAVRLFGASHYVK